MYFRENLLRELMQMLGQTVHRHVILIGPDGVGKRTLAYSLALLIAEGKGPKSLHNLVQIDERALLDKPEKALQNGLDRAKGGVLFIPHIHRFFGGALKAEFPKATPLVQKAFLGGDPVIIGSTTQALWDERLRGISAIAENVQLVARPADRYPRNGGDSQGPRAAHRRRLQDRSAGRSRCRSRRTWRSAT